MSDSERDEPSDISLAEVEQQNLLILATLQNKEKPWSPDGKCLYCGIREVPNNIALCDHCERRLERLQDKYPLTKLDRVKRKIAAGANSMTKLSDVKSSYRPPPNAE